ncbi:MAG: hypothetical protein ACKVQU_34095 [Burkholderiales bacterium]
MISTDGQPRFRRKRRLVTEVFALDISILQKRGCLDVGYKFSIKAKALGDHYAEFQAVTHAEDIGVRYDYRDSGSIWHELHYPIPFERTACHVRGYRHWFRCPLRRCGRRVAKLYLVEKYFTCRNCSALSYRSQQQDATERALHRAMQIRKSLGGETRLLGELPERPKRMHWATYQRLCGEIECAETWIRRASGIVWA